MQELLSKHFYFILFPSLERHKQINLDGLLAIVSFRDIWHYSALIKFNVIPKIYAVVNRDMDKRSDWGLKARVHLWSAHVWQRERKNHPKTAKGQKQRHFHAVKVTLISWLIAKYRNNNQPWEVVTKLKRKAQSSIKFIFHNIY